MVQLEATTTCCLFVVVVFYRSNSRDKNSTSRNTKPLFDCDWIHPDSWLVEHKGSQRIDWRVRLLLLLLLLLVFFNPNQWNSSILLCSVQIAKFLNPFDCSNAISVGSAWETSRQLVFKRHAMESCSLHWPLHSIGAGVHLCHQNWMRRRKAQRLCSSHDSKVATKGDLVSISISTSSTVVVVVNKKFEWCHHHSTYSDSHFYSYSYSY